MKSQKLHFLSALIAIVLLLPVVLTACGGNNDKAEQLSIAADGASDYVIVYSEETGKSARDSAMELSLAIRKHVGVTDMKVTSDAESEAELEILVGNTNREESKTASEMLGDNNYIIAVIGKKLVIYAASNAYYATAVNYLSELMSGEGKLVLSGDFFFNGKKDSSFTADELVDGKTVIDITVTPSTQKSEAGVFVGKTYDKGDFGYQGYAFVVNRTEVVLYRFTDKYEKLATKAIEGFEADKDIKLRLVVNKTVISAYLLNDPEGVEPWPEIELEVKNCNGYEVGFLETKGTGTTYKDLTITYDKDPAPKNTYTNAVYAGFADPDVLFYNGKYYLYGTGGSGYMVHTSTDLVNWKKGGTVAAPNLWGINKNYWAPDVEYINGKFYMVVSCNENLGIAVSDSPEGPFVEHSQNLLFDKTIDGHIFVDDDGKIYLYYVSWRGTHTYGIYGVELDQNMTPKMNTEMRVISPTDDWEKKQAAITEGPYMLKHNGLYYLTYSGSHYEQQDYAVGYAISTKPLSGFTKYKDNPIMIGKNDIVGAGHHCITTSPDGSEMIIVYHCHKSTTEIHNRNVCIDRIRFVPVEGGKDKLEVYGPTSTPQPYPSSN